MGKQIINKEYLDGYLQALLDVEEQTRFGSQYQQYYRKKTLSLTKKLSIQVREDYANGE